MPTAATLDALQPMTSLAAKQRQLLPKATRFAKLLHEPASHSNGMLFKEMIDVISGFRRLVPLLGGSKGYIHYTCSCASFHQYFYCPHVLALAIHTRLISVPVNRSIASIGRTTKRGRPKKAQVGQALTREVNLAQPHFSSSQADNPACVICLKASNSKGNKIVFCDICDLGWHQKCCEPALRHVPDGDWTCTSCF